jgi:hypothetical protein
MRSIILRAGLVVCAFMPAPAALAATITVGTFSRDLNCIPFGCSSPNTANPLDRYQQVYSHSLFATPSAIDSITFYAEPYGNYSETLPRSEKFSVAISTSRNPVNGLNLTNLDSNTGADRQSVYSGFLRSEFNSPARTLTFSLDKAFAYDPSMGDLLLDIAGDPKTQFQFALYFFAESGRFEKGLTSRATNWSTVPNGGGPYNNYGLVTTFGYTPISTVPEPSSWLLMVGGLGIVGAALRRKQRRRLEA